MFLVHTPLMLLSVLIGLPAAGYAWIGGWRWLGAIVFVATLVPPVYLSFDTHIRAFALIALGWAAVTCTVVWLVARHQQVVVQANNSLQRP
jgi:hypothetical protein